MKLQCLCAGGKLGLAQIILNSKNRGCKKSGFYCIDIIWHDPLKQNSDRSDRKSGPPQKVDQFFRNFSSSQILVEWIAPIVFCLAVVFC